MKRGSIGLMFLVLTLTMFLRGGSDIEQQAFVSSIGIDAWEDGKLLVSLQIPGSLPSDGSAMGMGGESSFDENSIVEAVGHSFIDATEILNATLPREVNYTQVLEIVVAEEIAQDSGFTGLLSDIMRVKDMRSSAAIIICRGKAQEILKRQGTFLGVRISTNIATQMRMGTQMGIIPDTNIGEVIRYCRGAWRDVIIPYVALNMKEEMKENAAGEQEGSPLDEAAGDLPQSMKEQSVDFTGAALLKDGRMIGSLTGMEMQFLSFLLNQSREFTFFVDDVYYRVHQTSPVSTQMINGGSGWIIRVKGRIQVNVLERGNANEDRFRDVFTFRIVELLRKFQALGVDPVGLQGKAVRNVLTISDWSDAQWSEGYQNATIEASIHVTIGEIR